MKSVEVENPMQTQNPIFEQMAKAMTEAAGAADGVRREAETVMKSQLQRLLADSDLVQREEFEAVQEMAAKARAENEELRARLEALEAKLAG
ncbi:MAG: accessory factor UbiK family protein [Aquisalinus sp.]|nr:accessory factor UbiK family protein [Aquisalinus sp.]